MVPACVGRKTDGMRERIRADVPEGATGRSKEMKDHMKIQTHPLAREENIIKGEHYRITVLTKSLVRLEYSPTGHFTDAAT